MDKSLIRESNGVNYLAAGVKASLRTAWRRWAAWVRVCAISRASARTRPGNAATRATIAAGSASGGSGMNPERIPSFSPAVGESASLPWVNREKDFLPQRGCGECADEGGRNPVGVGNFCGCFPRVARASQPWALRRNPFGIHAAGVKASLRTAWRRWAAWVRVCAISRASARTRPGNAAMRATLHAS